VRLRLSTIAVLAAALSAAGCGHKTSGQMGFGTPQVGVMVVKTEPVNLTVELTGRTSAYLVSDVRPQVNGVIRARLFREGSDVRAGQQLYQIDPAPYRAAYDSAAAGLAQAQALLTTAKLKADRYKDLVTIKAVSQQDYDDATATYQQDVANVAAQKAAVEQAKINLAYTRVLSPISGRIGKSQVTPGALVTANQATALATVQELDKIYVDVTQSAADVLKLERAFNQGALDKPASADVTLTLDDGSTYPVHGHLEFSDVTVDPGTGSVDVRAAFENPNRLLLPGLFVRAQVGKGVAAQGILVPEAAVSRDPRGEATVMVVGADGKAETRILQLGQTVGDKWLVTQGLKPGEQVIVEGLQKVQPGMPVQAVPAGGR
jgi:membrane fusion protein (multidrug efflux system)